MKAVTRIAVALALAAAVFALSAAQLGTAPTLGVFLALVVLGYAYGPTVVSGVEG